MYRSLTLTAMNALACGSPLDEASMLQMPVVEMRQSGTDESDCRCPGYFQQECEDEAEYGCVWTDAGSSNGAWCQCRELLEPGWVAPARPVPASPHVQSNQPSKYEATLGRYPGYSGDLNFAGSVSVSQSEDQVLLSWHLSGLEAQLCATPPDGVGNACGIHIHSGSTCDDASGVGGHYYHGDLAADPWSPVVYTPDSFGDSTSLGTAIAIGQSLSDVLGRAIVVHDHTGGRVSCGIIQMPPAATATMGRYPGYSGDLHFMGSVSVDESGDNVLLSWHLSGLEAQLCATPPEGVGNACGIHIHSGSTCDDASGVGGHYYHGDMAADPWSPVVYTPDAFGDSTSLGTSIAIGQSLSDVMGRAIVVHDHTGGRVSCGIIQAPPAATADMSSYPGYSGDLHFTGSVSVDQSGDNLLLSWHLCGLEAQLCATPPEGVGNACGIHIHSGSTCDDASGVGGHYYHGDMAADPWSPVVYTPDSFGDSMSLGTSIAIGQSLSDVMGRAIVVHDHTGARVACGIIA